VVYPDGDVDMAGPDEARDSYAPAAREHVPEEVAWLVEEAGEGEADTSSLPFTAREPPAGGGKSELTRE
jgi:hypothetical protein